MALLLHGLVAQRTPYRAKAPAHEFIQCLDFLALASRAPPSLDDLLPDALADLALRHNAVLVAYCAEGSVLPLRFGTAFSSAEAAASHLNTAAEFHLRALNHTGTFREYAIRLSLRNEPPGVAEPDPVPKSGRDFLTRGRLVRDHRRSLSESRMALARELLSDLRSISWQIKAAGAPKPDRLLDATLLVPPDRIPALAALAGHCAPIAAPLGLDLRLTGPWPAYSFDPENPPVPEICDGA